MNIAELLSEKRHVEIKHELLVKRLVPLITFSEQLGIESKVAGRRVMAMLHNDEFMKQYNIVTELILLSPEVLTDQSIIDTETLKNVIENIYESLPELLYSLTNFNPIGIHMMLRDPEAADSLVWLILSIMSGQSHVIINRQEGVSELVTIDVASEHVAYNLLNRDFTE